MENKVVIIIGSSRQDGHTKNLIDKVLGFSKLDTVDLNQYKISHYDYEHKNESDDFLPLMKELISNYDTFLFATPVYWYAMSGIMKVFFDRITDLLDNHKELGRKLRGKKMTVITSSTGDNLGDNFWLPFIETSKYLGMRYIGGLHTVNSTNNQKELKDFLEKTILQM